LKKKFVLDTNVILTDPRCIYKFDDNDIYIPLIVIEEVDHHKKGQEEKARNARAFTREIDSLRKEGKLAEGVKLYTGGKLFVIPLTLSQSGGGSPVGTLLLPVGMSADKPDDMIVLTAREIDGIVVSRDLNVRIKSDAIGVPAEDYKAGKVKVDNDILYSGHGIAYLSKEDLDDFRSEGFIEFKGKFDNEYFIVKEEGNDRNSALGKYSKTKGELVKLITPQATWGISPKNAEQHFALDALLDDDIKLVSLVGKAGTGKTLLAVAAGLTKTLEDGKYKKIIISRPVVPMGKDIGFLPGSLEEKLDPWMQPIYDNLDHLFGEHGGMNQQWKMLVEQGLIKIEALTYIRGRSIPNQFLIVDEAQNLSTHEIKTIITRVGEGTKVVLTGDPDQIDSPYLDAINNGLTYAADRMKKESIVAHVELTKGERSLLADLAAKLL
jgi:PhoH-like ATPase